MSYPSKSVKCNVKHKTNLAMMNATLKNVAAAPRTGARRFAVLLVATLLLSSCSVFKQDPLANRMAYTCDFEISNYLAEGTSGVTLDSSVAIYRWLGPLIKGGIMQQPGFAMAQSLSNTFVSTQKTLPDGRIAQSIWLIPGNMTKTGKSYVLEQRGKIIVAGQAADEQLETLGFTENYYSPRRNFCPG